MSARLPRSQRNGVQNQISSWFALCDGLPGYTVTPRFETIVGIGDWPGFQSAVRHAAYRTPYDHIGDYMDRWWYLPEIHGERARVHCTKRSDRDRDLHDHPWHFVSIILEGSYTEELELVTIPGQVGGPIERRTYRPGDILFRHAEHRHRLEIPASGECWSLVFTSPNQRDWGFWTPSGFVPWREYHQIEPATA